MGKLSLRLVQAVTTRALDLSEKAGFTLGWVVTWASLNPSFLISKMEVMR